MTMERKIYYELCEGIFTAILSAKPDVIIDSARSEYVATKMAVDKEVNNFLVDFGM